VGGRPVNIAGHRGHLPNKLLFRRDARLARDDARLMTGPFPHRLRRHCHHRESMPQSLPSLSFRPTETATATALQGATPCPPPERGCKRRARESMSRARTCDGPCRSTAGPRRRPGVAEVDGGEMGGRRRGC
jgi:hypothetical protein